MKLFWKSYSFLFLAIVSSNAAQLLDKDSVLGVYYNTMIVFSSWYIIPYFLNILNALINCMACAFIIGYAFNWQKLSSAPQWLFYARLLSDCTSRFYEAKMIQASFSQGRLWGCIGLASLIFPIIPSYYLLWRISLKHK
jgi:hypothetical protein